MSFSLFGARNRLQVWSLLASLILAACSRAAQVPPGFTVETLATNLNAATALAAAPDGRIFIADQTGPLRVWKQGRLLPAPALDLTGRVDDFWERGLIGVALHPDFPHTPHLFVLYVAKEPFSHHVVSRFTVLGDLADPASEFILLEGDDQRLFGGGVPHGHQGGPIRFGPDGKIYLAIGEQTAGKPSQSLQALQGKILRINSDGTIPEDNPFFTQTTGKYRAIWALGLRNPFGLAFQPGTARLFASDVGQTSWEEINDILPGANYGWPEAEGMSTNSAFTNPVHAYPPAIGRSIVGAVFYPTDPPAASLDGRGPSFPSPWRGQFFFADWAANWIKALDPDHPGNVVTFARGLNAPATIELAPDGSLLVLNRGTIWRDGKKWEANSGSLLRILYEPVKEESAPSKHASSPLPVSLASAHWLDSFRPLQPAGKFMPFEINAPPWQPGVTAKRWLALPSGSALRVNAEGEFEFPPGTLVLQQYYVQKSGLPFETHLLSFDVAPDHSRTARAAAYRWNGGATDAVLIEDGEVIDLPGDAAHRWFSPGVEPVLNLDGVVVGFLLPLQPRQLSAADLAAWNRNGWIAPKLAEEELHALPRLAPLDDINAPLEARVRSYLDVNCSACHRPGGPSRGLFDARFITPLGAQNLIHGQLAAGDLGIPGARVIVPGHPEKSIIVQRLTRHDPFRMPPVSVNADPPPVLPALREWIENQPFNR